MTNQLFLLFSFMFWLIELCSDPRLVWIRLWALQFRVFLVSFVCGSVPPTEVNSLGFF